MHDNHYIKLLRKTEKYAEQYIKKAEHMKVVPDKRSINQLSVFEESMPGMSTNPDKVLQLLHTYGENATVAQTAGRYFGFVNGGQLPIAHAADWLASTWDQNSALYVMSPLSSKLEEVCERWIVELLRLPKQTAAGFVSGSSNAILCALAAARNNLLLRQGYNVVENGMRNAPKVRVVLGEQAHVTVWKALSLLGFGVKDIEVAKTDELGCIKVDTLPPLDGNTLLILQAGNANGGGFDPINELCEKANEAGAWVHIDGAFGLWAAASNRKKHLVFGMEKADSWSVDAHKTLNVTYDCGIVLCKDRASLVNALRRNGDYLQFSENRDGTLYTTEMSRRSRVIALWAVLKQLGAEGVEKLIDGLCLHAGYFAEELRKNGFIIENTVCFNQFMVKCETPKQTIDTLKAIQDSGICWCGKSIWNKEPVIRVSVCSHRTTKKDIDKSVQAFVKSSS